MQQLNAQVLMRKSPHKPGAFVTLTENYESAVYDGVLDRHTIETRMIECAVRFREGLSTRTLRFNKIDSLSPSGISIFDKLNKELGAYDAPWRILKTDVQERYHHMHILYALQDFTENGEHASGDSKLKEYGDMFTACMAEQEGEFHNLESLHLLILQRRYQLHSCTQRCNVRRCEFPLHPLQQTTQVGANGRWLYERGENCDRVVVHDPRHLLARHAHVNHQLTAPGFQSNYLAAYTTKNNRQVPVGFENGQVSIQMDAYLRTRVIELSLVAAYLLGHPFIQFKGLVRSGNSFIFTDTHRGVQFMPITLGHPDNCLQTLRDLRDIDDEDTDIWLPDATEKYLQRPNELEHLRNRNSIDSTGMYRIKSRPCGTQNAIT